MNKNKTEHFKVLLSLLNIIFNEGEQGLRVAFNSTLTPGYKTINCEHHYKEVLKYSRLLFNDDNFDIFSEYGIEIKLIERPSTNVSENKGEKVKDNYIGYFNKNGFCILLFLAKE